MSTKRVTLDDALDALRKAVAEKGYEYQYSAEYDHCQYVTLVEGEARPACIVGHALVYLGVPAYQLIPQNQASFHSRSFLNLLSDLGYEFDAHVMSAFAAAQRVQDSSFDDGVGTTTWGSALAAAECFADAKSGRAS
jgi:hypothetical protein